jgi:hypothetical protein
LLETFWTVTRAFLDSSPLMMFCYWHCCLRVL